MRNQGLARDYIHRAADGCGRSTCSTKTATGPTGAGGTGSRRARPEGRAASARHRAAAAARRFGRAARGTRPAARALTAEMDALVRISRELRRDRELAFYGAEDLTPSGFYSKDDATRARDGARLTVLVVRPHV